MKGITYNRQHNFNVVLYHFDICFWWRRSHIRMKPNTRQYTNIGYWFEVTRSLNRAVLRFYAVFTCDSFK